MPHLEITKVILVPCNIVNNDYQKDSRVLCTIFLNDSFGQLLDISPRTSYFNSEFSNIEVRFIDQNCKPLEIEGNINIILVIN